MDIQLEIRTLSFWRALTAECIATFLYSLLVSLMAASSQDTGPATTQAFTGVVAGLAIATLSTIFLPVSGAHINPAVSLSAAVIQRVTPLRAGAYVVAQSGGAIAGASVVLGLYGNTGEAELSLAHGGHRSSGLAQFGLEFLLAFMIVLAYLRVTDESQDHAETSFNPGISVGVAYMAALVAYKGTVNPALALGQAFVRSRFSNVWIFWLGPVLGGVSAALCQEYIFSEQKDVQLSLTNAKTVTDDGGEVGENNLDEPDGILDNGKEMKDEGVLKSSGAKENHQGYNVNYKDPLTQERMILPTPPLPPWKGRRTVQRSYSSEMLNTDSMLRYSNTGIRKTSSNQNSHSLQRNNSHKHGNGNRNPEAGGARSGKHVSNKEVGSGKVSKPGKTRGPHHSSHNNHVSEVTSLHVSGAPDVTGPRGHHSHDAHYFVDY